MSIKVIRPSTNSTCPVSNDTSVVELCNKLFQEISLLKHFLFANGSSFLVVSSDSVCVALLPVGM